MIVKASKMLINYIGYRGENFASTLAMPIKEIIDEFGNTGYWSAMIKRNGDTDAYLAANTQMEIDGDNLNLTFNSTDMAVEGAGSVQLIYTIGTTIKATDEYGIYVEHLIVNSSSTPSPWVPYVNAVAANANRAEAAVAHYPYIDANQHVWAWDAQQSAFVDKGSIKGATGPTGPQGPKGDTGATGATGAKGDKGDKGDTGAQGPKGNEGPEGPQGPRGAMGPEGPQGPQGLKGSTGSQGPRGKDGEPGPNRISGLTDTSFSGLIKGYNGKAAVAQAGVDYLVPASLSPYRTASAQDVIDLSIRTSVATINDKIPAQASPTNKLADKAFVNSSISTATATFKGTYNTLAELEAVPADNNDYGFVIFHDAVGNTEYKKYKFNGVYWLFEYALNNSSFTAAQWAAINSGITAEKVAKIKEVSVSNTGSATDEVKYITIDGVEKKIGGGNVDSVNGKTGVVVLDASDVGALPDDTDIPEKTSDLTNDSGFITNAVSDLTNYYNKTSIDTALLGKVSTTDLHEYTAAEIDTLWEATT